MELHKSEERLKFDQLLNHRNFDLQHENGLRDQLLESERYNEGQIANHQKSPMMIDESLKSLNLPND